MKVQRLVVERLGIKAPTQVHANNTTRCVNNHPIPTGNTIMPRRIHLLTLGLLVSGCAMREPYLQPEGPDTSTIILSDISLVHPSLDPMSTASLHVTDESKTCQGMKFAGEQVVATDEVKFKVKSGVPITYRVFLVVDKYSCVTKFTAIHKPGLTYVIQTNYDMSMVCSTRLFETKTSEAIPIVQRNGYGKTCSDGITVSDQTQGVPTITSTMW